MATFEKKFEVRWADLDPNFHLRHSVYADYAAHVRLACLEVNGFNLPRLHSLGIGPILFSEKLDYFKEIRAGESVSVNILLEDMSPDGRKWAFRHQVFKANGEKAAEILVSGAWFDTKLRKVTAPPAELLDFMKTFNS